MTQTTEIKKYLEKHKRGITSLEAFERYGATRLASIIYQLRYKHHMDIETDTILVKTRYGRNVPVARYRLVK